jgi:glutaredoxin
MVKVEIFSGPQCTHCAKAKALLDQNDIPYIDYDISKNEHIQEFARRLPRLKAIPQIFINDNHIGNEEGLKMMVQDGRLELLIG